MKTIYVCESCDEKEFKTWYSALAHLKREHNIAILVEYKYDTKHGYIRMPTKYFCHNCQLGLKSITSVFHHISIKHGVCIWYQHRRRGKMVVYLDGLLRE